MHVLGFAVALDQLGVELNAPRCAWWVRRSPECRRMKIGRRYLVTNTRRTCSKDTLWRARR